MSRITSDLLTDTLNVVALARETALARGGGDQAKRLEGVADALRNVASAARENRPPAAAPSGVLAQGDFQALLAAAQSGPAASGAAPDMDRSQVVAAMSAGGMGEIDIARHLGLTREEVRLLQPGRPAARLGAAAYARRAGEEIE